MASDDPVTCAIHAKENGLLKTPGWKQFNRIAKNEKKLTRMLNKAKLRSCIHMFGMLVPKDTFFQRQNCGAFHLERENRQNILIENNDTTSAGNGELHGVCTMSDDKLEDKNHGQKQREFDLI